MQNKTMESEAIKKILIEGCDERIFLRPETDANKYHLNPIKYQGLLHRGSCTCGTLTADGHKTALNFLETKEKENYAEILATQANRLKKLLNEGESNFDVFFGPSGSDMMYLPILFQAILHGQKEIINIVSCPEELGSGSKLAAEGKYYSEWNQFGEKIPLGEKVSNKVNSKVFYLPARKESGHIESRSNAIRKIIADHPNSPIIGNLVFGSKSGIKDDLNIIEEVSHGIMWVVDMCQFRTDKKLIHDLLDKGVMIMVTGSKFYQAPPFCGALLVPEIWSDMITINSAEIIKGYEHVFSGFDFPKKFDSIRKIIPERKNIGLRLRWEIALDEMEKYQSIPSENTNAFIRRWNQVVTGRIAQSDFFKLMPNMELTNDSIISFMVLSNGIALDHEQLKLLFDEIVLTRHEGLNGFEKVFMGQPVQYGNKSFIRVAIGSYSVRKLMEKPKFDPSNDIKLIEIIENTVVKLFSK